jgi:hypothetical protein
MLTAPYYLLRRDFASDSGGQIIQIQSPGRHDDAASAFL